MCIRDRRRADRPRVSEGPVQERDKDCGETGDLDDQDGHLHVRPRLEGDEGPGQVRPGCETMDCGGRGRKLVGGIATIYAGRKLTPAVHQDAVWCVHGGRVREEGPGFPGQVGYEIGARLPAYHKAAGA
eukprot:12644486-Prorocentrum_lima.AAC.1